MTRREQCRLAQARYRLTEKGQATAARYYCNPERRARWRAASARYRATQRGQQVNAAINARRIFVGRNYHGKAQTVEQADAIHRHIKERLREFKQRLSDREEAEGVSSGAVSTQAAV